MQRTVLPGYSDDPIRAARVRHREERVAFHRRVLWLAFRWTVPMVLFLAVQALIWILPCQSPHGVASSARNEAFELGKSVELFKLQNGYYPSRLAQLTASPRGKPIMGELPLDPWGRPYRYLLPGMKNPAKFDIFSAGEDGLMFTPDDEGNWPEGE